MLRLVRILVAPIVLGGLFFTGARSGTAAELFIDQIGGIGNLSNVHQTNLLSGNEAFFIETSGLLGQGLAARLLQAGDLNVMLLRQIGQGNYVGSVNAQQAGAGNFASLLQINTEAYPVGGVSLPGHNHLSLWQQGENNMASMFQRGTANWILAVQFGTKNRIEVVQGYDIPSNFNYVSVRQKGKGNSALIRQD